MERPASQGGAYGVQILIAGQQKHWRDEVASQIRRAGYAATTVDCGVDAMTVLALGLPVDVLVTDLGLKGKLCCDRLVSEARALRPDLRIVVAHDLAQQTTAEIADDPLSPEGVSPGVGADSRRSSGEVNAVDAVATIVRQTLRATA